MDILNFKCPLNCDKNFSYKFLRNHLDSCSKLNVKCPFCKLDMKLFSYKEHELNCIKRKYCENCKEFCGNLEKICFKIREYENFAK